MKKQSQDMSDLMRGQMMLHLWDLKNAATVLRAVLSQVETSEQRMTNLLFPKSKVNKGAESSRD